MTHGRQLAALALALTACSNDVSKDHAPDATLGDDVTSAVDMSNPGDRGIAATDVDDSNSTGDPLELMARLGGLWVGPANQTPLGNIPVMPMDFRAADPNVLFARVDLDADNALRMAFFVEQIGDTTGLVFRNGGLFMGLSRDTRTVLESHDPSTSSWRFCEPESGCDYLDALVAFDGEDQLTMDVKVRGQQHMLWTATREETRELPDPFPAQRDPIGTGDAEFPPMPVLNVDLSWADEAPAGAWVWVILSDTPCGLTGQGCRASRTIGAAVDEGATTATLTFNQLHEGRYHLNAILDRDGNFQTVPFPQNPDAIVFPVDPTVTVPPGESTTSHTISLDVP